MIAQFSLRLICGMSLMWCLMPRRHVASGFFRIQMLIVLGLGVLASLTMERSPGPGSAVEPHLSAALGMILSGTLAAAAFLGSIVWTLNRRGAGQLFVFLIAGLSIVLVLFSLPPAGPLAAATEQLRMLSDLSSSAMLGGATTGMLLGHWYLTAPSMSIEPLRRLTCCFGVAGLVRLFLSGIGLALVWTRLSSPTDWLWLAMRWTAGIIGPLIVFVMVWRILRYRNTQAATGVLFVGVILTFIGETTAALLFRELSTPL